MLQLTNKGFTLLEMNVYLLIVASMGVFIIPNVSYLLNKNQLNYELSKLNSDLRSIQLAQLKAEEDLDMKIQLLPDGYIKLQKNGLYEHKSKCNYTTSFPNQEISINQKGRLSRAGKVTVTCGKSSDTRTFNIGYGYE